MNLSFPKNINIGLQTQTPSVRNPILEAVLLLVICGLFYWFVISPKSTQVNLKNDELTQVLATESKTAGELKTFNNLVNELKNHPDDLKKLDEAIPLESKNSYLQLLLENLANSAGVTIGNISVSGGGESVVAGNTQLINAPFKAQRTLQKLTGTVFVTGTFQQIINFLQKIETSGRLMQVSTVAINPALNQQLTLTLNLDAYYYAP